MGLEMSFIHPGSLKYDLRSSVSDPDSLNPDPDPAKNLNPDPDPDPDPGKFVTPTKNFMNFFFTSDTGNPLKKRVALRGTNSTLV